MNRAELLNALAAHPRYNYVQMENHDLLIADLAVSVDGDPDHHPLTRITPEAVLKNNWATIKAACTHARDVEHVTRVTGYFSRTASWNPGKLAELKDRHWSTI